jgi:hypothetical protein
VFTSPYGPRAPNQAIGITEDMHWGADYGPDVRNKKGVPLQAVIGGRITHRGDQYGAKGVRVATRATGALLVLLRRLYGGVVEGALVEFDLWHLASHEVAHGVDVAEGTVVGVMGSTGRSTGIHVHAELRIGGKVVDPKPFIDAQASKAVADAPADYYEEDDVALTEKQARALDWLFENAAGLGQLIDRRTGIDVAAEGVKSMASLPADVDGITETLTRLTESQRVANAQAEQVYLRRAALDTLGVRVEAIHAALPALQQARDVSFDADDIASLAASLAAALPKTDGQALIDALAKQLAKP